MFVHNSHTRKEGREEGRETRKGGRVSEAIQFFQRVKPRPASFRSSFGVDSRASETDNYTKLEPE